MDRWSKKLTAACVLVLAVTALAAGGADVDLAKVDQAVKNVLAWDYGKSPGDLQFIESVVVQAGNTPALRPQIEQRIIAGLSASGTKAGKVFLWARSSSAASW